MVLLGINPSIDEIQCKGLHVHRTVLFKRSESSKGAQSAFQGHRHAHARVTHIDRVRARLH